MAETPIRFAKGSAVWCQTTPVNYHDAVVLEDCVEGDAEAAPLRVEARLAVSASPLAVKHHGSVHVSPSQKYDGRPAHAAKPSGPAPRPSTMGSRQ